MALFGNMNAPGKGVLKTPHEKKGFFKFWEIYGRHMWKLMQVNLIYSIFCLPFIGMFLLFILKDLKPIYFLLVIPAAFIGPATAGLTKVARNFSQERNAFVGHDFMQSFRKNFKQGIIMGIIDVIFILGFFVSVPYYQMWSEQDKRLLVPYVICLACMIVFFMMHFYIYPMIVSTNLNMKQIFKNSFFLVSLELKKTLWTFLAVFLVIAICYLFFPYTLVILFIWPMSFVAFIVCFNCYPVIRKHVIQPYYDSRGEENPEFAEPDVETLFEDRAAEERKVQAESTPKQVNNNRQERRRGRTIR